MEKTKRALTICEAVKDATHSYLVAIAGIVSEKEGKFEGTGSIIEFGNGVFLITAAHVIPKNSLLPGGGVADLPSPDGLSGAAVWNTRRSELRETWTPSDARIVGIVHRWDQDGECLIATRIEKILPFLQRIEERGNR